MSRTRLWNRSARSGPAGVRGGGDREVRVPAGNGCESTLRSVLIFCMSEGAAARKGAEPEDTPNARVAE